MLYTACFFEVESLIVISSTKNGNATVSRHAKLASILSELSIRRLPFGMALYSLDFKLSVYAPRSRYSAIVFYCIHIAEQNFAPGYTTVIPFSNIIMQL